MESSVEAFVEAPVEVTSVEASITSAKASIISTKASMDEVWKLLVWKLLWKLLSQFPWK